LTTSARRVAVFFGALGCVALALILAVDAAAASASTESRAKRRAGLAVGQEFLVPPAAWLSLRPVWVPPGAANKAPAVPRVAAQTLIIADSAGTMPPPARGGHGSTNIPKYLPPFPGPASPIR
jgi:hypothetical protein